MLLYRVWLLTVSVLNMVYNFVLLCQQGIGCTNDLMICKMNFVVRDKPVYQDSIQLTEVQR